MVISDVILDVCSADLFCFKRKTAYELRISDWSSDVCSSDLEVENVVTIRGYSFFGQGQSNATIFATFKPWNERTSQESSADGQIGRATGRERVCQYV